MAQTVTFSSHFADPATPAVGRQLSALTITIQNQRREVQQVLTFPAGITQVTTAGSYSYLVTDFDVADKSLWPGTFIITVWQATDAATGEVSSWSEIVTIDAAQTIPTVASEREPYADISYSLEYFAGMRRGAEWDDLTAMSIGDAYKLLIEASDDLDTEHYKGQKLRVFANDSASIGRAFPRVFGPHEMSGFHSGTSDFMPAEIKRACCEQALWIHQQEMRGNEYENRMELQDNGITGMSRGRSSESYDLDRAKRSRICRRAQEMILPYLARTVQDTSRGL